MGAIKYILSAFNLLAFGFSSTGVINNNKVVFKRALRFSPLPHPCTTLCVCFSLGNFCGLFLLLSVPIWGQSVGQFWRVINKKWWMCQSSNKVASTSRKRNLKALRELTSTQRYPHIYSHTHTYPYSAIGTLVSISRSALALIVWGSKRKFALPSLIDVITINIKLARVCVRVYICVCVSVFEQARIYAWLRTHWKGVSVTVRQFRWHISHWGQANSRQ